MLQLLPPGHADGPSSASPGEVVVGQLEKVIQHGADGVVLVAVPLVVREPQPQLLGWHVAAAPDSDVAAGRSRDGLARRLLLRYVDRRGGRAVDLEVRVARQGRELCGGLDMFEWWLKGNTPSSNLENTSNVHFKVCWAFQEHLRIFALRFFDCFEKPSKCSRFT